MSSCCLKGLKIGTQSYSDEKSIPTHPLQAAFSRELSPASLPALCLSLAWLCVQSHTEHTLGYLPGNPSSSQCTAHSKAGLEPAGHLLQYSGCPQ